MTRHRGRPDILCATLLATASLGCSGSSSRPVVLPADMPLHLEDHLEAAVIQGSDLPQGTTELPEPVEWRFDEVQPDWRLARPTQDRWTPAGMAQADDALRLSLTERNRADGPRLIGAIYLDVPEWDFEDWSHVEIRARGSSAMRYVGLAFNHGPSNTAGPIPFFTPGDRAPVVSDGTVQTYRLSLEWPGMRRWDGPWTHLGIWFNSHDDEVEGTIDLLSIRLVPRGAEYAADRAGVKAARLNAPFAPVRRALYMHAPGRVAYRVTIPDEGRLDVGLGQLSESVPLTFAVTATVAAEATDTLLLETRSDGTQWGERSVDLSEYAGRTVSLALEAQSTRPGTVALWASPTVSGRQPASRPNVIFYVIDGGGAEYMSVYGYNRRTTPNLERLAAEGAVFERAYSNVYWTRPSTASFMTSLQHSVLGGFRNGFNVIPENAPTMAQHFHQKGYQTAVFTANPNAGRMSGLDRAVDFFREDWGEFSYALGDGNYRESSRFLHEAFWNWREEYPGEPYWVHFQTTDVHEEFPAVSPFSGLFVGPGELRTWREWNERLGEEGGHGIYSEAWERTGLSRTAFFALHQGLYDETLAHNDYQLGRLVDRLKAEGEWENTLLVIGADHSIDAAMDDMNAALQDSLPPPWSYPMFRPSVGRVPLIFVWPGHIPAGQRFTEPIVSMIDVLPTILDLVGLPPPDVMQGQSLAPLLLGEGEWEPRPVILEQYNADGLAPDEFSRIEVVDGRWGASLEISPSPQASPEARRPVPLLLYDLWNDPSALWSVHDEHPELVRKYTGLLEAQWEAHRALAQFFTPSASVALTPEQLETLRSLGYIR